MLSIDILPLLKQGDSYCVQCGIVVTLNHFGGLKLNVVRYVAALGSAADCHRSSLHRLTGHVMPLEAKS